jgi:hypothetical protein
MPKKGFIPNKLKPWIDARKKFRLSHSHVQMARQLGLNPKKLGNLTNHKQQSWKLPLPDYIEHLYHKRYGEIITGVVKSLEVVDAEKQARKAEKKKDKPLSNTGS